MQDLSQVVQVAKDRFGKLLGHDRFTRGWAGPFYYNMGSKRGLGDVAVIIRAMATYAIGDVQGSFEELQALLRAFGFDRAKDRLWFVGDLVNRGPASLATLRFVRDLGDRAVTVLGNHDLHLLALAQGVVKAREDDTLGDVLAAPDRGTSPQRKHSPEKSRRNCVDPGTRNFSRNFTVRARIAGTTTCAESTGCASSSTQ